MLVQWNYLFDRIQLQGIQSRTLKQFHFTKWPDEGIPEDAQELVNFISFVQQQVPEKDGPHRPLVIHCR